MALPTPSPTQLAALEALKAVANAGATGAVDKVNAIQSALDKQQDVEDFQKQTFDALNDEIIRRYEVERRWIDGQDIVAPIIENDVQQFAADSSGRLDNGGDYAPLRIPEFDGGPLSLLEPRFELQIFIEQDEVLDYLQNGIAGQVLLDVGANIETGIDENSTSVNILDDTTTINNDDVLFVSGGGFAGLLKVTNATAGGSCAGEAPPGSGIDETTCLANGGTWTPANGIDFVWLIPPTGLIPALSEIGQKQFLGFNNTERTNKVATDTDFQPLLDGFLSDLHALFDERKVALNNQLTEIQANQDDNIDPNAETNVTTSISAIDGFLGVTPPSTIDISDTGITAINDERNTRQPQATSRPGQIASAIMAGDFYNLRFGTSEGRCRLNNGSIVLLNDLESAKIGAQEGGIEAANLASRYDALIP